jgi:hypothetical protein
MIYLIASNISIKAQSKVVGIAYSPWHPLAVWPNIPDTSNICSWAKPALGYYKTIDTTVIDQHTQWLTDAGIDYVSMDWSNNINGNKWIEDYTAVWVDRQVWRKNHGLSYLQIVIMIGCPSDTAAFFDGRLNNKVKQVQTQYINDPNRGPIYFKHRGKPLVIVYINGNWDYMNWNHTQFDNALTIRLMFATLVQNNMYDHATMHSKDGLWSWSENVHPPAFAYDGRPEWMAAHAALRTCGWYPNIPGTYPTYLQSCMDQWGGAKGRRNGATLQESFAYATKYNVDVVQVMSFDEWTGCERSQGEQRNPEYSNDIEPMQGGFGDLYLKILKEEVYKFKGITQTTFWHFDSTLDGWNTLHSMTSSVSNSLANMTITASDPYFYSPDNINMAASDYKYIIVSMQNKTSDTTASFFWNTTNSTGFDGIKTVNFSIVPNDTIQRYYIIDLSTNPNWTGTIRQIRLDPVANVSSGTVAIDFIKFAGIYPTSITTLPGVIETENFDKGGQGNAYNDSDPLINNGGQYRTNEGVDIQTSSDLYSGYNVGWINSGEWLEYLVNIKITSIYTFISRIAASTDGNQFHIEVDGKDKTGIITVNNTGGIQTYIDFSKDISIMSGLHVIRLVFDKSNGGFNVNKITVSKKILLSVDKNGLLLKNGIPYRAIGVNFAEAVMRLLDDPNDTTVDEGFKILAQHNIPFVRLPGASWNSANMALYSSNPTQYFLKLDKLFTIAEKYSIGIIFSVFFPDWPSGTNGERGLAVWDDTKSATHKLIATYIKDLVTRYKLSPALLVWEWGNEENLVCELPNASDFGQIPSDQYSYPMMRKVYTDFGNLVRTYDTNHLLNSGEATPPNNAWHRMTEKSWTLDNTDQFMQIIKDDTPDPLSFVSIHAYTDDFDSTRFPYAVQAANDISKPLLVGEFGVSGSRSQSQELEFANQIAILKKENVGMAALWEFDVQENPRPEWVIYPGNDRWYMIDSISKYNYRYSPEATFTDMPITIPGTIEAENYNKGGEGISYHDIDSINSGGKYRTDGVDIDNKPSGGYSIGWTAQGEWLEYSIVVQESAMYKWLFTCSSVNGGGIIQLFIDDNQIQTKVLLPKTNDWNIFKDFELDSVSLPAGLHILKVYIENAGFNLDKISISNTINTQSITLNKGWNLISTNIVPDTSVVGSTKASLISTLFAGLDIQEIKTMDAYWRKDQNDAFNSLKTLVPGNGYLVKMNTAGVLAIKGTAIKSISNTPLLSGWNLIGCSYQIAIAIAKIYNVSNCLIVKNFDGFWLPNGLVNSLILIEPSKAYFIRK